MPNRIRWTQTIENYIWVAIFESLMPLLFFFQEFWSQDWTILIWWAHRKFRTQKITPLIKIWFNKSRIFNFWKKGARTISLCFLKFAAIGGEEIMWLRIEVTIEIHWIYVHYFVDQISIHHFTWRLNVEWYKLNGTKITGQTYKI